MTFKTAHDAHTTSHIPQKELGVGGVAMVFEIEANVADNIVAFAGWVVGGRPARCAHADTHARTNASPCFFELGAHKSSRRAFACVHVCTHAYIYAVRSNARMHNVHTHLHKFMYVFCQSLTSAAGDRPSCQIAMEFRDLTSVPAARAAAAAAFAVSPASPPKNDSRLPEAGSRRTSAQAETPRINALDNSFGREIGS